jgi:hypothetical protein
MPRDESRSSGSCGDSEKAYVIQDFLLFPPSNISRYFIFEKNACCL